VRPAESKLSKKYTLEDEIREVRSQARMRWRWAWPGRRDMPDAADGEGGRGDGRVAGRVDVVGGSMLGMAYARRFPVEFSGVQARDAMGSDDDSSVVASSGGPLALFTAG